MASMQNINTSGAVIKNKYTVCRLCSCASGPFVNIFYVNSRFGVIPAEVIQDLLRLEISMFDSYPEVICDLCLGKVAAFRTFKELCLQSKHRFDKFLYKHSLRLRILKKRSKELSHNLGKRKNADQHVKRKKSDTSSNAAIAVQNSSAMETVIPDPIEAAAVSLKEEIFYEEHHPTIEERAPLEWVKERVDVGHPVIEEKDPLAWEDVNKDVVKFEEKKIETIDLAEEDDDDIQHYSKEELPKTKETEQLEYSEGENNIMLQLPLESSATEELPILIENVYSLVADQQDQAGNSNDSTSPNKVENVSYGVNPHPGNGLYIKEEIYMERKSKEVLEVNASKAGASDERLDPEDVSTLGKISLEEVVSIKEEPSLVIREEEKISAAHEEESILSSKIEEEKPIQEPIKRKRGRPIKKARGRPKRCLNLSKVNFSSPSSEAIINSKPPSITVNPPSLSINPTPTNISVNLNPAKATVNASPPKVSEKHNSPNKRLLTDSCPKRFHGDFQPQRVIRKTFILKVFKKTDKTETKRFCCNKCVESFETSGELEKHRTIHKEKMVKEYNCRKCHETFETMAQLKKHRMAHGIASKYICNLCKRGYLVKSHLVQHMSMHRGKGVVQIKCPDCSRWFSQRTDLRDHSVTHLGIRAHKCSQCQKYFRSLSNLTKHTCGNTPDFPCSSCSRIFTEGRQLEQHFRFCKATYVIGTKST